MDIYKVSLLYIFNVHGNLSKRFALLVKLLLTQFHLIVRVFVLNTFFVVLFKRVLN